MLNDKRVEDLELPAIPCGLIAKSFFNDTFELYKCYKEDCQSDPEKNERIEIKSNDIAWSSDVTDKFNNILNPPKDSLGKP